jgi:hypothetical protein
MRTLAIVGVLLGATALLALGQFGRPLSAAPPAAPAAVPPGGPGPGMPMEPMFGTKLEWFLAQPGRVAVRDVWDVGGFEAKAWDAPARDPGGRVHVHAVAAFEEAKPTEKVKGVMLVLTDAVEDRTFFFDANQVPELLNAIEAVRMTTERLPNVPQDARRRAVYIVNGLEIARNSDRAGGYLGQAGPDAITVRLNPDNFLTLRDLLTKAQETLVRNK